MLSTVIITYNEEHNIRRCLESLEGIGDEILVVDSGSLDSTAEICRSMGATVIEQDFLGYIEQKNFATSKAKNEYKSLMNVPNVQEEIYQIASTKLESLKEVR